MRERHADAAAAAAEIQNARIHFSAPQGFQRGVHQHLGVHARDQNILRHVHRKSVELPITGDIGQRLSC